MNIEVILKEHVEHLGRRGEIVKVAPGYARTYLLPRNLALAVTAGNKRQIERERAKAEARDAAELLESQALKARLELVELAIARRVGENETLYGSVTAADVADALATRDLGIDRRKIQLPEALKTLGDHVVQVKLQPGVVADVKVKIVPAE